MAKSKRGIIKMKKTFFKKNEEADVLGLPMYLIIIMIVAVAVIAAVIFMMPKGNQMMDAHVTSGSVQGAPTVGADQIATFGDFSVTVKVTTKGDYDDPIGGASVRLGGCHAYGEGTTGNDGIATVTVQNAQLPAGVNEGYLEMTVKSSGYEDVVDDQAVMLIR
jgi:hypothetical protein